MQLTKSVRKVVYAMSWAAFKQPELVILREHKVYQQPAMKSNHLETTEETTETEFQLIIANCVTTD